MLVGTICLQGMMWFQQSHAPLRATYSEQPQVTAAPGLAPSLPDVPGLAELPESCCHQPSSRHSPSPSSGAALTCTVGSGSTWGACAIGTRCPLSLGKGILTKRLYSPSSAFSKLFFPPRVSWEGAGHQKARSECY